MAKKGYSFELKTKKRYEKKGIVFRLSIYSYCDFLVLFPDSSILLIECKTTKKNKFSPSQREVKQFQRLLDLSNDLKGTFLTQRLNIIYCIREAGKERELSLDEVKKRYFSNKSIRLN